MKIVKNNFRIFCTLSLFAMMAFSVSKVAYASVATIENPQGEVLVHSASDPADNWKPVTQNTPVNSGDGIQTKNGTCALVFGEQATFQVESNTSFTLKEETDTQNIELSLGNLKGKVHKEKVVKPFQVVTAAAVAAVRGTDVDFGVNDEGAVTVDLHDGGPVQVFNEDSEMSFELAGKKKVKMKYDAQAGILDLCYGVDKVFKHEKDKDGNVLPSSEASGDCGFTGSVSVKVKDKEYNVSACDCQELDLGEETAAEGGVETTGVNTTDETVPNEGETPTPSESPTPTPPEISNIQPEIDQPTE